MSANVIIFEGQYMADLMRNMDKAKQLTEEAMGIIKKANQHRNWKCKETAEINNNLDTISNRIQRLNTGIMRTNIALGKGLQAFHELEQRSETQASTLSSNLKNNYGFDATDARTGANAIVATTMIPAIQGGKITVSVLQNCFNELHKKIHEFWKNFINRNNTGNTQPAPTVEVEPSINNAASETTDTSAHTANITNEEQNTSSYQEPIYSAPTTPVATQTSDKWGWNTENLPFDHNTPDLSSDAYNRSNSEVLVNTRELYNSWAKENRVNCVYYARARYLEVNGEQQYHCSFDYNSESIKNGNCVVRFNGHSVYVEHYDAENDIVWFSDSNMGSHHDGALQSKSFEDFKNFSGGFQYVEAFSRNP